jgi:hypothetical protein
MVTLIQKGDLAASSFSNDNSNAAGGVKVRVNAGSDVKTAIDAAITAIPDASDTVRGLVQLADAASHPQATNDTAAATPAYVAAAIAAIPGDIFLTGLASYDDATNIMTLNMSDGSTVDVDLTGLLNDAVATITTGKVQVLANDGTTVLGHLLPA